jgi:hypothetical protein
MPSHHLVMCAYCYLTLYFACIYLALLQWGEGIGLEDNLFMTNEEWMDYADGSQFVGIGVRIISFRMMYVVIQPGTYMSRSRIIVVLLLLSSRPMLWT